MRCDDEMLDALLCAHAAQARDIWLATLPNDDEIPIHKFSQHFLRKMKTIIRQQRRSSCANIVVLYAKRAVACLAILVGVTFAGCMSVEAYREQFITWVAQALPSLTHYQFVAVEAEGALPAVTFGYLPAGMEEMEAEQRENARYILYGNAQGEFFTLDQSLMQANGDYQMILDTENAQQEICMMDGVQAIITEKGATCTIFWSRQNTLYLLSGNIGREELKKIAEKIE